MDSMTKQRSDGALVRLVVDVGTDEDWAVGDKMVKSFTHALGDELSRYIPE